MRNSLLPLAFWCVLIASCGIRNSKVVLDPYYRNTSKSEADNDYVAVQQNTSKSQEVNLNCIENEGPPKEEISLLTSNSEKFNPLRIPKTSKNHQVEISESTQQNTNEEEPQLVNNEFPSLKTDFKKDFAPVKNEVIHLTKAFGKTNNQLSLPHKISIVKSVKKQYQQQFIHYSGYNNAMEYGFKAFVYGLILFIVVTGLFYMITGGGTTNIVIGLIYGLLGALSIVATVGGLLLWFGGWIAYLLGYF
jgi:hypothetical protein